MGCGQLHRENHVSIQCTPGKISNKFEMHRLEPILLLIVSTFEWQLPKLHTRYYLTIVDNESREVPLINALHSFQLRSPYGFSDLVLDVNR